MIAPSKAPRDDKVNKKRTQQGVSFFNDLGLGVRFGNHVYDREYFSGATIENRVKDIHDMFSDPEIKAIIMIVGGNYANLIIDKLHYDLIAQNPKIFIGMSDGTLLTNAIYLKSGLQTYYGTNLNDGIGFKSSQKIIENIRNTLFGFNPIVLEENKDLIFSDWGTGNQTVGYDGWKVVKSCLLYTSPSPRDS